MISLSELLTINEVWNALSDRLNANPALMERIKQGSPNLAVLTYFSEPNSSDLGIRHFLPSKQLLASMAVSKGIEAIKTQPMSCVLGKNLCFITRRSIKRSPEAKLRYDQRH